MSDILRVRRNLSYTTLGTQELVLKFILRKSEVLGGGFADTYFQGMLLIMLNSRTLAIFGRKLMVNHLPPFLLHMGKEVI